MRYRLDFLPPPKRPDLRPWLAVVITVAVVGVVAAFAWYVNSHGASCWNGCPDPL